jgi:hypothetical protein
MPSLAYLLENGEPCGENGDYEFYRLDGFLFSVCKAAQTVHRI